MALSILCGSKRFVTGSQDVQRGCTTAWESLHRFVYYFNNLIGPHVIKFPVGADAIRSINTIKEELLLP